MKRIINKYHLGTGLLVAVLFPGIFVFADNDLSWILIRFLSSFIIIISLWVMNFSLINFGNPREADTGKRVFAQSGRIILSFILSILIYVVAGFTIDHSGSLLSGVRGNQPNPFVAWLFLCIRIMMFNALIILIKYLFDSHADKRKVDAENEALKRENLNAMLEVLKQKVHPHFLFNSLTTLKSLTRRDPEQAASFINELSTVYRYMLLHQDKKEVSLGEEIDFMKSYLYLLKIRFGDAIQTKIGIPEEVLQHTMPPNTLQLLVENAVKHNALSAKKPLSISISLRDDYLAVENNLQPKSEPLVSSRFGLYNISSRYQLLKGRDIVIHKSENSFQVLLPIF